MAKNTMLGALSREMANFFREASGPDLGRLRVWLLAQNATAPWQSSDPVQFARVQLAIDERDGQVAADLIRHNCWPTFLQARGRDLLDLWYQAQYAIEEAQCKCTLTEAQKHRIRLANPAPPNLLPDGRT